MLEEGKKILAYSYEELLAEKLRALVQRLPPRELYDVVHLYQQKDLNTNLNMLRKTLQKNAIYGQYHFLKSNQLKPMITENFLNQNGQFSFDIKCLSFQHLIYS